MLILAFVRVETGGMRVKCNGFRLRDGG